MKGKKAALIFLAIILALPLLACKSAKEPGDASGDGLGMPDENEKATAPPNGFAELPAIDYGGVEFVIANISGYDWCDVTLDVDSDNTGEMLNDAIYRRNRVVEDKYNVIMKIVEVPYPDMSNKVKNQMLAGACDYELIQVSMRDIARCTIDNYIADAKKLDQLDLTNPWWDGVFNESTTICGRQFFLYGDFTIADKEYVNVIFLNKDLQKTYGLPDFYQIVREGKWTQAAMLEAMKMVTIDLNGDGKWTKEDQYGLTTNPHQSQLIFYATGANVVKKDKDDMPYWTITDEFYLDAFSKTWTFLNTDNTTAESFRLGTHQDNMFADGKALFDSSLLAAMRAPWDYQHSMEQDFGVLPTPKLDENQEQYLSPMALSTPCMVITNNEKQRVDRACVILEAFNAKSSEEVQPKYRENALPNKCFRDEESFEMLDIIMDNRVVDLAAVYGWGGIEAKMQDLLNSNGYDKVASTIEQMFEKSDAAMKSDTEKILGLEQ
ncbi:MAG: extracellular solute-binding protein [Oscillospiraceae bacterium]|nr:extracellular solute-binding protein [Oscillospiraceae bacterium]